MGNFRGRFALGSVSQSLHPVEPGRIGGDFHRVVMPVRPRVARVEDWWRRIVETTGAPPSRTDLDLCALKAELPHLVLLDILDGGADFHYRLVGTKAADCFDRDVTGQRFSEVDFGDHRDEILCYLREAVDLQRPVAVAGQMVWRPRRDWLRFELVLLPLVADGATHMILMAIDSA